MYKIYHVHTPIHFCVSWPVAQAVARHLGEEYGDADASKAAPMIGTERLVQSLGGADIYEVPASYPAGTTSQMRYRFEFDAAGGQNMPWGYPPVVYFEVGKVMLCIYAHQHLSLLVDLDRALDDVRETTVWVLPPDPVFEAPVRYVKLHALYSRFAMSLTDAQQLRAGLLRARNRMNTLAAPWLNTLSPLYKHEALC